MSLPSLGKRFLPWILRSSNKSAALDLMNYAERIDAACSSLEGTQRAALDAGSTSTVVSQGKKKATTSQTAVVDLDNLPGSVRDDLQTLADKLSQSTGQPDITEHFETEERIRAIGGKLDHVQDKLCELGSPITKTDISISLNAAIDEDTDALRQCVRRTAEQHRQLREAVRPILVLRPDASEAVQQKTRAFLEMEEVVQLREELMDTVEAFSGAERAIPSLTSYKVRAYQLDDPSNCRCFIINDRPGATLDCLIHRLLADGTSATPEMFIRKQGNHTLTRSGRCWEWASGMELLQNLEAKDENGVRVVDYVDTEYPQFAIAVVDDGRTECGHILELPVASGSAPTIKAHFEAHLRACNRNAHIIAVHRFKLTGAPDVSEQEWSMRYYQVRANEILVKLQCKSDGCITHEH